MHSNGCRMHDSQAQVGSTPVAVLASRHILRPVAPMILQLVSISLVLLGRVTGTAQTSSELCEAVHDDVTVPATSGYARKLARQ